MTAGLLKPAGYSLLSPLSSSLTKISPLHSPAAASQGRFGLPGRGGDDVPRHQLDLPRVEFPPFSVGAAVVVDHHVELGKHQNELSPVSSGEIRRVAAPSDVVMVDMPGKSILMLLRHRVGHIRVAARGLLDPLFADDAVAVPDASVQIELSQLEQVARPKVRAAAHVRLAGGGEVEMVVADVQRLRDPFVKYLGQPSTGRLAHCAADEIGVG